MFPEVLTGATIVKLTRTLAIIPITLVLGFYQAKKAYGQNKASIKSAFPMFILYFIILNFKGSFDRSLLIYLRLAIHIRVSNRFVYE